MLLLVASAMIPATNVPWPLRSSGIAVVGHEVVGRDEARAPEVGRLAELLPVAVGHAGVEDRRRRRPCRRRGGRRAGSPTPAGALTPEAGSRFHCSLSQPCGVVGPAADRSGYHVAGGVRDVVGLGVGDAGLAAQAGDRGHHALAGAAGAAAASAAPAPAGSSARPIRDRAGRRRRRAGAVADDHLVRDVIGRAGARGADRPAQARAPPPSTAPAPPAARRGPATAEG